jgi:hypothetical protein
MYVKAVAVIEGKHHAFGPAVDTGDLPAGQQGNKRCVRWGDNIFAQVGDRADARSTDHGAKRIDDGLYFRQFRHPEISIAAQMLQISEESSARIIGPDGRIKMEIGARRHTDLRYQAAQPKPAGDPQPHQQYRRPVPAA